MAELLRLSRRAQTIQGQLEILREDEEAWKDGNYKRCADLCTVLINANSEQPKANFFVRRARANLELRRFNEVLNDTERAIRFDHMNSKAFALQGYATYLSAEASHRLQHPTQNVEGLGSKLRNAITCLIRAKELDPSLEKSEVFQRYWRGCERDRIALENSVSETAPLLSTRNAALDKNHVNPSKGEDALLVRASLALTTIPPMDESVKFKSELLYMLASLSRRCFQLLSRQYQNTSFLDVIKRVRTLGEIRDSLEKTEIRIPYEAQMKGWRGNRHAWLAGIRLAANLTELFVSFRTLQASIQTSSYEMRPDLLAQQVRAVVNDIDAVGEEVLQLAHPGEDREICVSLLSRAIEDLPRPYSYHLSTVKARCLSALSRYPEAMASLNAVVLAYNQGSCSRSDLDSAMGVRDHILRKVSPDIALELKALCLEPSAHAAPELFLTSLGSVGHGELNRKPSRLAGGLDSGATRNSAQAGVDEELMKAWMGLSAEERREALAVRIDRLEKRMPHAMWRKLHATVQSIGSAHDLVKEYCKTRKNTDEDTVSEKEWAVPATLSQNVTNDLREEAPDESRVWTKFESLLDDTLKKAIEFESRLEERNTSFVKSNPFMISLPPKRSILSSLGSYALGEHAMEMHMLSLRDGPPKDFSHASLYTGWEHDNPSTQATLTAPMTTDTADQAEVRSVTTTDDRPFLLLEEVYCVKDSASDPNSKGIFVPERCAKVCHADKHSVYVGRMPLFSECGEWCQLSGPYVCPAPEIARKNKQTVTFVPPTESAPVWITRPSISGLDLVLREEVMNGDDEEALARRLLNAMENTEARELEMRRSERWLWALEQVKGLLQWTVPIQRAFVHQYDDRRLREFEEFANKAAEFHRSVIFHMQREPIDADTSDFEDRPVTEALSCFHAASSYRQSLRCTQNDIKGNLVLDEEKLIHAMPSGASGAADVLSQDYANLSAIVVSRQQSVAYFDTRIAESDVYVATYAIYATKACGTIVRDKARWILGHSSEDAISKLSDDTPFSADDLQAISQNRQTLQATGGSKRDFSDIVVKATDVLRSVPRCLREADTSVAMTDLDHSWKRMSVACENVREFMVNCAITQLVPAALSELTLQCAGIEHNTVQGVKDLLAQRKQALQDTIAMERWRRAEYLRYVHVRNQVLYQSFIQVVKEEVKELNSRSMREAMAKQLMEEEDRARRKVEKRKQKRGAISKPILTPTDDAKSLDELKGALDEEKNAVLEVAIPVSPTTAAPKQNGQQHHAEKQLSSSVSEPSLSVSESSLVEDSAEWVTVGGRRGGNKRPQVSLVLAQSQTLEKGRVPSDPMIGKAKGTTTPHSSPAEANGIVSPSDAGGKKQKTRRPPQPKTKANSDSSEAGIAIEVKTLPVPAFPKIEGSIADHAKKANPTSPDTGPKEVPVSPKINGSVADHAKDVHPTSSVPKEVPNGNQVAILTNLVSGVKLQEQDVSHHETTPAVADGDGSPGDGSPGGIRFGRFESSDSEEDHDLVEMQRTGEGLKENGSNQHTTSVPSFPELDHTEEDANGEVEGAVVREEEMEVEEDPTAINGSEDVRPPFYPVVMAPMRMFSPPPVPPEWVCPLTHQVMVDPVTAADGHIYEHFAIADFLAVNRISPMTGEPVENLSLVPNHALRLTIQQAMAASTMYGPPTHPVMHPLSGMPMFRGPVGPMPPVLAPPAQPPQGPVRPLCIYFQQGTCRYGPGCRNLHVLPSPMSAPFVPGPPVAISSSSLPPMMMMTPPPPTHPQ